jgi:hypothetical protein
MKDNVTYNYYKLKFPRKKIRIKKSETYISHINGP